MDFTSRGAGIENKLTFENVYQKFKAELKEDISYITDKEQETGVNDTDGAHIQFGMVVVPYLYHLVDIQDDAKIEKCFAFFDQMATSPDDEMDAIVQFSVLEYVVTDDIYYDKLKS